MLILISWNITNLLYKVEKILKGSLDSISSPSPSVKLQIMGWKVCFRCKGKTLLGIVNKLLVTKSLLTTPSNVLPLHLKQTFPPTIWILTEDKLMGSNPGYLLEYFLFYGIYAIGNRIYGEQKSNVFHKNSKKSVLYISRMIRLCLARKKAKS